MEYLYKYGQRYSTGDRGMHDTQNRLVLLQEDEALQKSAFKKKHQGEPLNDSSKRALGHSSPLFWSNMDAFYGFEKKGKEKTSKSPELLTEEETYMPGWQRHFLSPDPELLGGNS